MTAGDAEGYPRPGRRARRLFTLFAEHGFLIAVVVVSLLPLYMMLAASLQPRAAFVGDTLAPPGQVTFENYATIWSDLGFGRMFVNSALLSLGSAGLSSAVALGAAYALMRFRFRGRTLLFGVLIALMAIPAVVIIIPIFVFMSDLRWVDTYQSAILVEAGIIAPFSVILLYTYMRDLPAELFEAADVDGASRWTQFRRIAVPLSLPALATTTTIAAIYAWNDLLIPLILWPSDRLQTLMVGLATLGPGRTGVRDIPLLMAGVTISVLPLILVFLAGRRALIRGLVEGSNR
jgi:ABC-type glycerol-3-phosphate transport system permease component